MSCWVYSYLWMSSWVWIQIQTLLWFFQSPSFFVCFTSQQNCFSDILFFLQKHFFKAYSAFRIFFLSMSGTKKFFHQIYRHKKVFQKKTHSAPFRLNEYSLTPSYNIHVASLFSESCTINNSNWLIFFRITGLYDSWENFAMFFGAIAVLSFVYEIMTIGTQGAILDPRIALNTVTIMLVFAVTISSGLIR